jgi:hypothetical protein
MWFRRGFAADSDGIGGRMGIDAFFVISHVIFMRIRRIFSLIPDSKNMHIHAYPARKLIRNPTVYHSSAQKAICAVYTIERDFLVNFFREFPPQTGSFS